MRKLAALSIALLLPLAAYAADCFIMVRDGVEIEKQGQPLAALSVEVWLPDGGGQLRDGSVVPLDLRVVQLDGPLTPQQKAAKAGDVCRDYLIWKKAHDQVQEMIRHKDAGGMVGQSMSVTLPDGSVP